MRVLVACEFSGIVRDAFTAAGHDAVSCDLLPSERPGEHYQGDVLNILDGGWDLMVAHPPCTHLAVSGARWFPHKRAEQREAIDFVIALLAAPIPYIALENPVSILSSRVRSPDQVIQPWQFGHPETKATCLWLKNLQPLQPTSNLEAEMWSLPPKERHRIWLGSRNWMDRSRTLQGIADAMADQWSFPLTLGLEGAA